jgi:hypothetical protein
MSVLLTNTSGSELEIEDGQGGTLKIPAGETAAYLADTATDQIKQLLAAGALKIEDEPPDFAEGDDDDDDC